MATKEQQLSALAAQCRDFINGEIPTVGTWNINPGVDRAAVALIGTFFTDTDTTVAALLAKFNVDHDPVSGKNPTPAEWVAEPNAPTFRSAGSVSLPANRTADYAPGHRVRLTLGPSKVIVGLDTVTYDPALNITLMGCTPASVNSSLSALERALIRFSAPRVTTADLVPGSVPTAALADGAVTSAKIAALALQTQHYADRSVTINKIGLNAVGQNELALLAVSTNRLQDLSVTAGKLAAGAATTAKIADQAVTEPKLADQAVSSRALADGAVLATHIDPGLLENLASANLLRNGSFESFSAGTTVAPDAWALTGAGAVASRSTGAQQFGTAGVQLVAGTAGSYLAQTIPTGVGVNLGLRDRVVTFVAMVQATVANAAQLSIDDGVAESVSAFHTGDGTWQRIYVTRTIHFNATQIVVRLRNIKTDSATVISFDGAMLTPGAVPPLLFSAHPNDEQLRAQHYQDLNTNRVLGTVTMQSGWGFATVPNGTTKVLTGAIVFPVPFRTVLGGVSAFVGRKAAADPTTWRDAGAIADRDGNAVAAIQGGGTGNGFTVALTPISGDNFPTIGGPWRYLFTWQAWGVL